MNKQMLKNIYKVLSDMGIMILLSIGVIGLLVLVVFVGPYLMAALAVIFVMVCFVSIICALVRIGISVFSYLKTLKYMTGS